MRLILPAARIPLLAMLLGAAILITGCGLKGDLYLPEPEQEPAPEQQADDGTGDER